MSKSFRTLLIAGGCSWTNDEEDCYKEAGIEKVWPDYVADFLDMDVLNVAHGGAGNDYIYGQTMDAILQNKDRNIVVMVAWSQAMRFVPFELHQGQISFTPYMPDETNVHKLKNTIADNFRELCKENAYAYDTKDTVYKKAANISMRNVYLLNEYCKDHNIPLIHHRALHMLHGLEWIMNDEIDMNERKYVNELCMKNYYYDKIKSFENVVGNPDFFEWNSSCFDLYNKFYISDNERHPTSAGHKLIASSFVEKYLELYDNEPNEKEPVYVYD